MTPSTDPFAPSSFFNEFPICGCADVFFVRTNRLMVLRHTAKNYKRTTIFYLNDRNGNNFVYFYFTFARIKTKIAIRRCSLETNRLWFTINQRWAHHFCLLVKHTFYAYAISSASFWIHHNRKKKRHRLAINVCFAFLDIILLLLDVVVCM